MSDAKAIETSKNDEEARDYAQFLCQRRQEILDRIAQACQNAGRDPYEVELLAVSKTVDAQAVELAWQAGYRHFGENRPQELRRKRTDLASRPQLEGLSFDMIGNLQTNKINMVVGDVRLIHSISSLHLAEAVSKRASARELTAQVLLEVNVSGEESKSGFSCSEAQAALESLLDLPGLALKGLMTMAPKGDLARARSSFAGLRELRDRLELQGGIKLPVLSCGMSDDYELAIEEGSTLIRLGRTVFDSNYR